MQQIGCSPPADLTPWLQVWTQNAFVSGSSGCLPTVYLVERKSPRQTAWGLFTKQTLGVNGGAEGDRTPDLSSAIAALSQLSYGPRIEAPFRDWPYGLSRRAKARCHRGCSYRRLSAR